MSSQPISPAIAVLEPPALAKPELPLADRLPAPESAPSIDSSKPAVAPGWPTCLSIQQRLFLFSLLVLGIGAVGWFVGHSFPRQLPEVDLAAQTVEYLRFRKPTPLTTPLQQLLSDPRLNVIQTQPHSRLGQMAPDFALPSATGPVVRLSEQLKQGPVVLVFYYGYTCSHCVAQLFDLNEDFLYLKELDATVLAVSADPVATTRDRFAKYGGFQFPVLSDTDHRVAALYDTFIPHDDPAKARLYHGTFLIGRDGKIYWADVSDQPFLQIKTLLFHLAQMQGRLPVNAVGQPLPNPGRRDS